MRRMRECEVEVNRDFVEIDVHDRGVALVLPIPALRESDATGMYVDALTSSTAQGKTL